MIKTILTLLNRHETCLLWGQGTYDPTHVLFGFGAHAEEGVCRGRMGKSEVSGGTAQDEPIIGIPELQREEQRLDDSCRQKSPLKETRVEWDPRRGTVQN